MGRNVDDNCLAVQRERNGVERVSFQTPLDVTDRLFGVSQKQDTCKVALIVCAAMPIFIRFKLIQRTGSPSSIAARAPATGVSLSASSITFKG